MTKKKEHNYWKIALISLIIFIVITFLWNSPQNNNYNKNNEYESASQEWKNYQKLLNNDQALIDQYLQEYTSVQDSSDISYINAKLAPRLDIYDTHLIESRNFLNQYGYLFLNKAELKAQIDDMIVNSRTIRNNINIFVEDYNREVADYNKRVQTVSNLFKLLL